MCFALPQVPRVLRAPSLRDVYRQSFERLCRVPAVLYIDIVRSKSYDIYGQKPLLLKHLKPLVALGTYLCDLEIDTICLFSLLKFPVELLHKTR